MADIIIRRADRSDAVTIASIHIASRRSTYKSFYAETYMAGPIEQDTRAIWASRLVGNDVPTVLLADQLGLSVGFLAWVPAHDPIHGGMIDNFHVLPDHKCKGIGRLLFREICAISAREQPGQPLFLWVYEENAPARQAYARLGGVECDRISKPLPDGNMAGAVRVVWAPPTPC